MIAIWIILFWENLKCPKKFNLIELGAGNGEMMKQIVKTFDRFLLFKNCCKINILEKSIYLKKIQKKKRGVKQGSKKGRKGARVGKKEVYVIKVRSLRYRLKIAKDRKEITNKEFWELYKKIGGNTVRNIAHLRTLIEEITSKQKDQK